MTINWEAVGAIGEVLGGLVVIATLFYLASQLRQNSAALKRSNEIALNQSKYQSQHFVHEVFSQLSTDGELASIYTRALAGEALSPAEQTRYHWFVNSYLVYAEHLWDQQKLELGWEEHDAEVVFEVFAPYVVQLLTNGDAERWWRETAVHHFLPHFTAEIDAVLEQYTAAGEEAEPPEG